MWQKEPFQSAFYENWTLQESLTIQHNSWKIHNNKKPLLAKPDGTQK